MSWSRLRPHLIVLLPLVAGSSPLAAQSRPPEVAEPVVNLQPFHATGSREAAPGTLGLGATAGDAHGAPRAVTWLEGVQLREQRVYKMEDLAPLVPGAVAAPPYGITGVPQIRGDLGDAAQNGQRRAFNRNVFPVSFNGVESVEVLAGAPPAFLGYTHGTGGYVNLLTKRPSFDGPRGSAEVTAGAWDEWRGQVDWSRPWSERLAGRLSVERAEHGGFHRLAGGRSWDVFGALAWRPAPGTRWDLSVESYQAHYLENPGTNRPTQALVDRGEYITGSSVQGGGSGRFFRNTFTPTGTTRIDGSQILAAPGDGAWARSWTAQLVGGWDDAAGRRVTSRTYFEHLSSEKHAAYQFYSFVPRSRTLEQRIEIAGRGRTGGWRHEYGWGAALRGEERESYVDFLNEAMNAFDLTMDADTFRFPVDRLFGVLEVPGKPGRFAVPGGRYGQPAPPAISQTLRSRLGAAGVFAQDRVTVGRLTVTLGARGDLLAVQAEDPLPRPGFAPARDGLTRFVGGGTLGAAWQANRHLSWYVTYNDAAAVESSSSSGGFGLTNNRLPTELFANRSRLLEAGGRVTDAAGGRAAGASVYQQRRHRQNPRTGLPDEIEVSGVELMASARLTERLEVAVNGAFTAAHFVDGPPAGSIATVPGFDPAVPSPSFSPFAPGNYRLPGWPRWQANVFARWVVGHGLTLRATGRLQGPQNLDLFGVVRLPAQQTWDAGLTWVRQAWELRLDVLNATDEFNWRPTSTPFAGGDLVTRELPRHWRASIRYAF